MPSPLHHNIVRLATTHSLLRPHLLRILASERFGREFPTTQALQDYLKEHPKADKARHTVADPGAKGGVKVNVDIDPKEIAKRAPKIDSPDLQDYGRKTPPQDLKPEHREEIKEYNLTVVGKDAAQAIEIARKVREGISKSADICKLNPTVCSGNLGLSRDKMPQIEGEKSVKQMLNSSNPLDRKKGEAMVQAGADPDDDRPVLRQMLDHLKANGVRSSKTQVPVGTLRATQSEIKASKTYGMADTFLKGKFDNIADSIVVSRDGHILDGHHRWAALLTIDPGRKMNVEVIDMDMKDLLEEAQSVPGVYKADFAGDPLPEADQKEYKSKAKSSFKKKKKKKGNFDLMDLADLTVRIATNDQSKMMETTMNSDTRSKLIRLAYENPPLRAKILSAITKREAKAAGHVFPVFVMLEVDNAERRPSNQFSLSGKMRLRVKDSEDSDIRAFQADVSIDSDSLNFNQVRVDTLKVDGLRTSRYEVHYHLFHAALNRNAATLIGDFFPDMKDLF